MGNARPPGSAPSIVRLYAVRGGRPRLLELPRGVADANALFDELPLGIYEALRTFGGTRLFGLAEHFERARRSMRLSGWPDDLAEAELRESLAAALEEWPEKEARVRIDVLAASSPLTAGARTLISLSTLTPVPRDYLERGVEVPLSDALERRDPLIKRAAFVLERRPLEGGSRERYEPILVDRAGRLLEGISSSFLAVRDGALHTAADGVLEGITCRFLLELASAKGTAVRRSAVRRDELATLEEAFLCSSIRGVVPIVAIEGIAVGDGRPGPITRALSDAYDARAEREARSPREVAPRS